jgi:hypothetical protein
MLLFSEENIISLRTAIVQENEDRISLFLAPRPESFATPDSRNYLKHDVVWLYRRRRSFLGELLVRIHRYSLDKDIRIEPFATIPRLNFEWADSGNSVAVFLEGIPWAFIHEAKNHGYSKGILRPTVGNPWNQALFEATFTTEAK